MRAENNTEWDIEDTSVTELDEEENRSASVEGLRSNRSTPMNVYFVHPDSAETKEIAISKTAARIVTATAGGDGGGGYPDGTQTAQKYNPCRGF